MGRHEKITDADMLDYVEGRMSADRRAWIAARMSRDPDLSAQCTRVHQQTLNIRLLRSILPIEGVPQDWLDLLAKRH